jgi:5'(3')-deoxyribonucleotidase
MNTPPYYFGTPHIIENFVMSRANYRKLQNFIYNNLSVAFNLEPVEDAFLYIRKLRRDGHEIRIITSRKGNALEAAVGWLREHDMDLPIEGVGVNKSKARAAMHSDIFIDDSLKKLYQLMGVVPHRFLFSWGYNKSYDEGGIATRVNSWEDFYKHINKIPK